MRLDEGRPLLAQAAARNPRAARRLRQMAAARPELAAAPGYGAVLAALVPTE